MALFNYELLVTAALSYLLGSIPFGYILVRIFRGEDVRLSGSGNIGATNVSRKSPLLGVLTLLLDALKGSAAVALGIMLSPPVFLRISLPHIPWRPSLPASLSPGFAMWTVTAVLFVLLGHMFPVWLKFRGGKGGATGMGSFVLIAPKSELAALGIFIAVVFILRYVSLGSIVAVASFPLVVWLTRESGPTPLPSRSVALASQLIIAGLHEQMRTHLQPKIMFVSATKGLEEKTLLRMTEVISQVIASGGEFQPRIGALSGPSFAKEVARGDPTAITIASKDAALVETVQREFSDPRFRVYTNDDVVGVELGGALKNIIAIAAGVCDGLGLGHNSIAALITRGLAEITRLAMACGGRRETMAGLAGLGDLVLTCTGGLSRNRSVGVELGRGRKLSDIIAGMHGMVAEGVFTTHAALGLARARGVEMPITQQMNAILHEGKSPGDAIQELMTRTAKSEVALSG